MVLHIDTLTVDDLVDLRQDVVAKGRFDATRESTEALQAKTLLANIHAKIVNLSPRATVEMHDGVVTLGQLEGSLKSDKDFREQTAKELAEEFNVQEVVFNKPVSAKRDHINTFYNLDV